MQKGGGLGLHGLALPEITPGTGTELGFRAPACTMGRQLKDLPMKAVSQIHSSPGGGGHAGKVGLPSAGHLSILLQLNRP